MVLEKLERIDFAELRGMEGVREATLDFNGTPIAGDTYSSANIQMTNQGDTGSVRSVTVTSTGLISAQ